MDPTLKALWEMIEAGGRTAQAFGLNRLLGQSYALLYLSDQPLSLDEIAENLGVSKGSISIACRQLEAWAAVRRIWKKGDRRDYYEAEVNMGRLIREGILTALNKKLDTAKVQFERSLQILDGEAGDGPRVEFLRERLAQAEKVRSRISRMVGSPMVRKLL